MVADFFALQRGASAVFQQIGEDAPVGDLDVEFNPRFDLSLGEVSVVGDLAAEGSGFVAADGQLSVAWSAPANRGSAMRTGRRCTILIQLPLAFCAGSSENALPVPRPRLTSLPR